jgi:hypothetical protein
MNNQLRAPGTSSRQAIPSIEITARWIAQIAENPAQPIARSDRITAPAPKYPTSAPIIANPTIPAMIEATFMTRRSLKNRAPGIAGNGAVLVRSGYRGHWSIAKARIGAALYRPAPCALNYPANRTPG